MPRGSRWPGMVVHHEVLREQLEHHAVVHQLHEGGAVDGAVHVALFDLAGRPSSMTPRRVGAAHRGAAHAHHGGFHGNLRARFGLAQRRQRWNRRRAFWSAIRPFDPAVRSHRARAEKAQAAVFEQADHAAASARCPRPVPPRISSSLPCALYSFAVIRSSSRRSKAATSGRALADFRIVRQESLVAAGVIAIAQHQLQRRGLRPASTTRRFSRSAAFTSEISLPRGPSSSSRRIMPRTRARRAGSSSPP